MAVKCPKCQSDNPDDTIYCGKCATPLKSAEEIPITKTLIKHLTTRLINARQVNPEAYEAYHTGPGGFIGTC